MTSPALTGPPAPRGPAAPGDWQSLHVFYAASPRPLLLDCVRPLVDELTRDGLLSGYFFINYWLQGLHVRLRLKPSSAAANGEVRDRALAAVQRFLTTRPALYEVKAGFLADLYNTLFELEYPQEQREKLLGPDGRMLLRDNNSVSMEPYEPEYGKYGGPAGVALAEWHFQRSSDLVVEALRTMNLHVRTVLLGTAAQLMMVMSASFLDDDEELAHFLERYHAFWDGAFSGTDFTARKGYDRAYEDMGAELGRRFTAVRAAIARGAEEELPAFLRGWALHCRDLAGRVRRLAADGELVFRRWSGGEEFGITDERHALAMLMSPYMHMTNNRLSVTIRDEAFLAYVLARTLRGGADTAGAAPGGTG